MGKVLHNWLGSANHGIAMGNPLNFATETVGVAADRAARSKHGLLAILQHLVLLV